MAIRFRKYFKQCKGKRSEGDRHGKVITKGIECDGKRGRLCPENVPSPCGRWLLVWCVLNKFTYDFTP